MLDTRNDISAESEEYRNKRANVIQVKTNKNPEIGYSKAMTPNPVATPLPPENFIQTE